MAREMKLPELGENIESAEVLAVLVSAGDKIKEDQPVVELETDKATAEVPAAFGGIVREIRVKAGDQVTVGQVLLTMDDAGAPTTSAEKPAATTAPDPAPATPSRAACSGPTLSPSSPRCRFSVRDAPARHACSCRSPRSHTSAVKRSRCSGS